MCTRFSGKYIFVHLNLFPYSETSFVVKTGQWIGLLGLLLGVILVCINLTSSNKKLQGWKLIELVY